MSSCDQSMEFTTRTAYKAYSCEVKGALGTMVKSITGICNVRGQKLPMPDAPLGLQAGGLLAGSPPGAAFCKLQVTLHQEPENPMHCSATQCTFAEGQSGFSCAKAQCTCIKTGVCIPVLQDIINNIKESAVGIDCKADGSCTLEGMQPRLDLTCSAGECTQPQLKPAPLPTLAGAPAKPFPVVALVACAVPIALAAMGALGLMYVVSCGRMFTSGGGTGAPARSGSSRGGGGGAAATAADAAEDPAACRKLIIKTSMTDEGGSGRGGRARLLPAEACGAPVTFDFDGIYCVVPDRGAAAEPSGHPANTDGAAEPAAPAAGSEAEGKHQKVLLYGVSGSIAQGEVVGVMGPSGAGKSTLLSILSGATESVGAGACIEGSVTLGGEGRRSVLRKVTAFVPQRDVLLPALTVEECVRYSALLRLPRDLGAADIQVGRGAAWVVRGVGSGLLWVGPGSALSTRLQPHRPSSIPCVCTSQPLSIPPGADRRRRRRARPLPRGIVPGGRLVLHPRHLGGRAAARHNRDGERTSLIKTAASKH
jgi:hypothetical protein